MGQAQSSSVVKMRPSRGRPPLSEGDGSGNGRRHRERSPTRVKCTIVGDVGIGKTCLLISYTGGEFPADYMPTVFDNSATVRVNDEEVKIQIWDTAGQEEYDRLRPLSYEGTDVFILGYNIAEPSSFMNAQKKWMPELRAHCPRAAVILVGLKCDLREISESGDPMPSMVSRQEAVKISKLIKASDYIECSARTSYGVKMVFDSSICAAIFPSRKKSCFIM